MDILSLFPEIELWAACNNKIDLHPIAPLIKSRKRRLKKKEKSRSWMKVSSCKEDATGKMKGAPPLSRKPSDMPPQPSQEILTIPAPGRFPDSTPSVESVKPLLVSKSKWRRRKRLASINVLPSAMPPVEECPISVVKSESVGNETESGCTYVRGNIEPGKMTPLSDQVGYGPRYSLRPWMK